MKTITQAQDEYVGEYEAAISRWGNAETGHAPRRIRAARRSLEKYCASIDANENMTRTIINDARDIATLNCASVEDALNYA